MSLEPVVPKQRHERFHSVGDHIHAIPTFDHGEQPQDIQL